eukprot:TRINITY_DN5368_c0_g1_i1.p1 TRINITY_DN5368_c0_g1~~TRINITY_DN5368_c0_g1_i1.p1  ORF type:complete len:121 (+),score=21.51 TRINITY_DN5368_c0_g1_i1:325-687(+)
MTVQPIAKSKARRAEVPEPTDVPPASVWGGVKEESYDIDEKPWNSSSSSRSSRIPNEPKDPPRSGQASSKKRPRPSVAEHLKAEQESWNQGNQGWRNEDSRSHDSRSSWRSRSYDDHYTR